MRRRPLAAVVALAALVVACSAPPVETPDPEDIPTGSLTSAGDLPTGPIVEVGSGVLQGIGWRYAIFPTAGAWCTQLETVSRWSRPDAPTHRPAVMARWPGSA